VTLAICCLSLFIVGIDVTIVNVALPSIQHDLHASISSLQWTVDAYTLVLACLLMLSGSVADRFGRKRVFQVGLTIFSLGSLLCSVAPSIGWLIAFRALQAIGGSMLNPVALSIIANTYTDPKERAKAMGIWGGVVGLSLALGPVLGGVLVTGIGWQSVFWINIPIGTAAIILTQRFVPESKAPRARRLDPPAQALIVLSLGMLVYAIIDGPQRGWVSTTTITCFAVAALSALAFVLVERRRREPLLDIRFFHSAPFSGATTIALFAFVALGGFLFLNTLYLQDARGYSPLHAGLITTPMALMTLIFAPLSGRLVANRGPRLPLMLSGAIMAAGALLLARLGLRASDAALLTSYSVFGIGFGLVNAPISNTAVSGMPRERAGVAGAVASTGRQIGASLGVAISGSLVAGATTNFVSSSHTAWDVIAGCGVAIFLLGYISTGPWALRSAERTAIHIDNVNNEMSNAK
jgi:EmrB/QacA subfamily drug resistance transporter